MPSNNRPADPRRSRSAPGRTGAPHPGKPQRTPQPRTEPGGARPERPAERREPSVRQAPGSTPRNSGRRSEPPVKSKLIDLPMAAGSERVPEAAIDGMVYIAYGENGDDVAFELSDEIEEAVAIVEQMREDGFAAKLFQAVEIDIVMD